jgi:hypothetical protein
MSPTEKQLANLHRRGGRARTVRPRIYVGCMPCGVGVMVADITHANRWIERHWERCKTSARDADGNLIRTMDGRAVFRRHSEPSPARSKAPKARVNDR